jgi:hypothetical protein
MTPCSDGRAVADQSVTLGRRIQSHGTSIQSKKPWRTIKEAIETGLHPDKMNRDEGFSLGASGSNTEETKEVSKDQWLTPSWFDLPLNWPF